MSQLVNSGKRLDKIFSYINKEKPEDNWILSEIVPLFINAIKSKTSIEEENIIVNKLNELLDSYEFRYDQIFEVYNFCPQCLIEYILEHKDMLLEAEYQGRKVPLGKPFLTPDGPKKRAVYVKNKKGNVVKVNFGQKGVRIKKNNPKRRKSFRARHKCDTAKDRTTPRYWSCRYW